MSNETTARKVAEAWQRLLNGYVLFVRHDGKYYCAACKHFADNLENLTHNTACVVAVISTALKPAPIATPGAAWSREKPTEIDMPYWFTDGANIQPSLIWLFERRGSLRVKFDTGDYCLLEDLDGWFSGPLTAPQFVQMEDNDGNS